MSPDAPHTEPRGYLQNGRAAEQLATDWMNWLGFTDASCTRASRDGGIDVVSSRAVAQVKLQGRTRRQRTLTH